MMQFANLKNISQTDIWKKKEFKKRKDLKYLYCLKIINQHLNV